MTDWKNYKSNGPWEFTELSQKLGYINNPRWTNQPEYIGKHTQCGYWNKNPVYYRIARLAGKWWQPSIDVYKNMIGVVPIRTEALEGEENKILGLTYDMSTNIWRSLGESYVSVYSPVPSNCRITEEYMAFYSIMQEGDDVGTDVMYGRLYIFQSGSLPRYKDLWVSDKGTGDPYELERFSSYGVMDCKDDTIVCAGFIIREAGVSDFRWQVKISTDRGYTFTVLHDFPTATSDTSGQRDKCIPRFSSTGDLYVAYLRNSTFPRVRMIEVWKSDATLSTLSKVWERDFDLDLDEMLAEITFDIDEESGEIVVVLSTGSTFSSNPLYIGTYYSSDGGTSFSVNLFNILGYYSGHGIAAGQYIILPAERYSDDAYGFVRSTNYGASFAFMEPGFPMEMYYQDAQKYKNTMIYTECGESFELDSNKHGMLFSSDNGANWELMEIPVETSEEGETEVIVDTGIGPRTEPPIVWELPS